METLKINKNFSVYKTDLGDGVFDSEPELKKLLLEFLDKNKNGGEILKNLAFVCEIIIGNVAEFIVGEKFQFRNKNKVGIQLWIGDNFKNWVLEPMKSEKVSLTKNSKLKKFSLVKPMNDTEIKDELQNLNPIAVEIFLPLLWDMLSLQKNGEARKLGLLNNGCANIFHVKLQDGRVVAVRVGWDGDEWRLLACGLDCVVRWFGGFAFFTLATA